MWFDVDLVKSQELWYLHAYSVSDDLNLVKLGRLVQAVKLSRVEPSRVERSQVKSYDIFMRAQ